MVGRGLELFDHTFKKLSAKKGLLIFVRPGVEELVIATVNARYYLANTEPQGCDLAGCGQMIATTHNHVQQCPARDQNLPGSPLLIFIW